VSSRALSQKQHPCQQEGHRYPFDPVSLAVGQPDANRDPPVIATTASVQLPVRLVGADDDVDAATSESWRGSEV
jgi:hypothetical protein